MAWNDLTPAQQEAWKKKNFNTSIRVPQSAIDKLMAGKTKANNIKKYSGTDNKVMREAMNRFYGKGWDKGGSGGGNKPAPKTSKPQSNQRGGGRFVDDKPGIPTQRTSKPKAGGRGKMVPVTSVTPNIQVKAVSKKKQAQTREMLGALATVTGVGGAARLVGTAGLKAIGSRVAGGTIAKVTGKTGAQQASRLNSRLNAIRMQQAQGQLAASEAKKLAVEANLKFNRTNTIRVAQGQSGVVQGVSKAEVKRQLNLAAAKASKKATAAQIKKATSKAAQARYKKAGF
jgi:hypothetical protein